VEFGFTRQRSEGLERTRADGWNEILIGRNSTIRFVLSNNPGTVLGLVSGISREPVSGAPVFLEGYDPDNHKRLTELRMVYADGHGHYQFNGLSPGSYRVLSTFEFRAPDAASMDTAGAKVIKVDEGRDIPQDLDLSVIR
jgi:hypothetical protein